MAKKKSRKPQQKHADSNSTPLNPTEKSRLDEARKLCRSAAKYIRNMPPKARNLGESFDFDEARSTRRTNATLAIMDAAKALTTPICPDIPGIYDFEHDWLEQNLILIPAHDHSELRNHNLLAASLWMLDQLRDERKFFDACQLFPRDNRIYDELDYPDIWDVSHDDESICGMLWTIRHRNDDCTGLPESKQKHKEPPIPRPIMDEYTARNLHQQDVPSRDRFRQILAMIPMERIDAAVRLYEDTFWDVVRRIYASRAVLARKEQELDLRNKEFIRKADDMFAQAKKTSPLFLDASQMRQPVLAAQNPIDLSLLKAHDPVKREKDLRLQARHLDTLRAELDEAGEDLDLKLAMLRDTIGEMLQFPKASREDMFGPEIAAIWEDFRISDPYALSFAHLYLVEENSDLPWVYGISCPLMELCGSVLPWHFENYEVEEDPYWLHYNDEAGGLVAPENKPLPKRIKEPELEDLYAMEYEDRTIADAEYRDAANLSQILYEITGGVMPRNLTRYRTALEVLDGYGISGKKALHPLMYCMTFLGESRQKTHVFHLPEELLHQPAKPESEKTEQSSDDLQAQIRELQLENQRLRTSLYEAGREARDARKKLESVESIAREDRQELADLRELVYHQQEETYYSEPEETSIEFPYSPAQRIVVFGGHESWAREIKQKLPGVRFIDRTMIPNAELIRHADVVWLQTNALAHAYFYKIIDEARKHRIPVRYFSYASATKCAEQLVREDLKE